MCLCATLVIYSVNTTQLLVIDIHRFLNILHRLGSDALKLEVELERIRAELAHKSCNKRRSLHLRHLPLERGTQITCGL